MFGFTTIFFNEPFDRATDFVEYRSEALLSQWYAETKDGFDSAPWYTYDVTSGSIFRVILAACGASQP